VREELLAIPEATLPLDTRPTVELDADVLLQGHGSSAAVLALPVVGRTTTLAVAERAVHSAEESVVHAAHEVEHILAVMARRTLEVSIALVGLVVLGALLPFLALAIRLDTRGPVVFRQTRLSKGGRPFTIYKLRTMSHDAERRLADVLGLNIMDGPTFKAPDDPRVTRVGRVLRRFSLDELPQFWNVLRGDMALVGPRPPLPSEWALHDEQERRRLAVTPGITGLWQVSGRSHCPHQRMVELDLEYVRRRSLWLDLSIILRTVPSMFRGWGAY
jgi:lipopolysaccharide/colanic/teichoic acid biosynthesis glycosyltransferase